MKYSVLTFLLTSISVFLMAQVPENIASDRPGNAYTSTTVGLGVFQAQEGLEFGQSQDEFDYINGIGSLNKMELKGNTYAITNYLRYGIGKKSEINAVFDLRSSNSEVSLISDVDTSGIISSRNLTGLSKISLGFRQNILEEEGNIPALGVLLNANFNGILNDFRNSNPDGFLLIIAQKQLSNIFSFTTNLGFNYGDFLNDGDFIDSYLYTLNLGYSITPKLSGYVEAYGQIANGEIVDAYDAGFGYLLNKDIQLDLYGGFYSEENYFDYFVTGGVSFRIGAN